MSRRCFGERPPLLPPFRNAKTRKSNAEFQVAFGKKFNKILLEKAAGRDEGRAPPTAKNVSMALINGPQGECLKHAVRPRVDLGYTYIDLRYTAIEHE